MRSLARGLDKLVMLQVRSEIRDAAGGTTAAWTDFEEVWAGFRNLSGEEKRSVSMGGEVAVARTEVTIRYHPDVNDRMRLAYNGKFYSIKHVNNWNEQNWKMILTCDTGMNE